MTTMKAVRTFKVGDPTTPDVLQVEDNVPVPEPKQGQVLIKVHAASINPADWKMVQGAMPGFKPGSFGFDVCGVVQKLGAGVSSFEVGHEVYAFDIDTRGSFAEFCVVNVPALAKKPTNVNMAEAASLPLCGLTALQGLVTQGKLTQGQSVLILGGSGGVGSLAVQMAKPLGASTVTATGSDVALIKSFGADAVVNYKEENLLDALKGKDFDLVYDTIGGYDHWELAQACLKKDTGIFVTIAGDNTGSMFSDLGAVLKRMAKSKLFGGIQYKLFMTSTKPPAVVEDMKKLTELVESGDVKPVLHKDQYELTTESIHEMIRVSKSHRAKGKLVCVVQK